MDTIEYARFRYDTVEVENGLKTPYLSYEKFSKSLKFMLKLSEKRCMDIL